MALLTLKDIGKIYVSEGNVSVGIRGVDLSFSRGEFVAVTGKSGSGKSTLLNVISGMDSYEEGELFIEGEPTSHYLQPDWEKYREKYISFIFQDYNIIESFTVLENVELALLHIEDKKARRARAMELIRRVGLDSHAGQKGSRLSGGQKQRTVIARALAKDSPIILADEPTGNLDSVTSREIIELLKEVSKDKLLIVVTHNFEQVADHATRHIRIFDGAVEFDHAIRTAASAQDEECIAYGIFKKGKKATLKNGLTLGKAIFWAKPRLSLFLCLLMLIGTLGIFMITALCGEAGKLFSQNYMFRHIDGRVVVTTQNGEVFSEAELCALAEKYGAESYLRYDVLLDDYSRDSMVIPLGGNPNDDIDMSVRYTYGENFGDGIIGRMPNTDDEVFLYLPISCAPYVGTDEASLLSSVMLLDMPWKVVGVKYYYDNNLDPMCLFTEMGFRTATAVHYLIHRADGRVSVTVTKPDGKNEDIRLSGILPSFDLPKDKVYIHSGRYSTLLAESKTGELTTTVSYSAFYYKNNYYYGSENKAYSFDRTFTDADITKEKPSGMRLDESDGVLVLSDELLREIAEATLSDSYKQASLFFADDKAAKAACDAIMADGYIAVTSDTTYEADAYAMIETMLAALMMAVVWFFAVVFLAFFIHLCTSRTLDAFKGDMAIMRSMGIPVKVIRIGMYTRMLISLIPAFLFVALCAILIFTSPKFNAYFVYLYAWQYALIFAGMLILTLRLTHKQVKRLFGESVKRSLKGGASE